MEQVSNLRVLKETEKKLKGSIKYFLLKGQESMAKGNRTRMSQ